MSPDKLNLVLAKATGLISSLLNVALYINASLLKPEQLQSLHQGSTKAYLCSPLCSISFYTAV